MSGKIGIVTVLYKSESVLPEFFESLEAQTYKNFILYIVDNKSPDNSLAISEAFKIKSTFETVVIANDDNYGVAKGNNIGIKQALSDNCDYVLLSNNDVVIQEKAIEHTLLGLIRNNADFAASKILFYKKDVLWYAGGSYSWYNGWCIHYGMKQVDKGQFDIEKETVYAPTCFLLIKKGVFLSIGLMDEAYFVYWDDTDFVYRARKKNFKLFYIPSATIEHNERSSTGGVNKFTIYYIYRNLIYFSFKNRNIFYAIYISIFNITVHTVKHLFSWSWSHWTHAFKAMYDGLKLSNISKK